MATQELGTVERKRTDPLEAIAKVAGLLAITLPLVGIGVRFVAFQLAGVPIPFLMATHDSVVGLATTAFIATWPSVLITAVYATAVYRRWIPGLRRDSDLAIAVAHPRYWKWRLRLDRAAVLSILAGTVLLLPWPGGVLIGASGLGMGMAIAVLEIRRQLSTYSIALLVVAMGAANALGAGLEGQGIGDEVDMYYFTAKSGMPPDGQYIRLGEADGVLYLQSCGASNPLVAVNSQDVARLAPGQPTHDTQTPVLLNILIRHQAPQIGYHPRC
jgi:hypothetical protein